jgi:hypothetical protein
MCKICVDWQLGKLTLDEAWRNLGETRAAGFDSQEEIAHYWDVAEMLSEDEES